MQVLTHSDARLKGLTALATISATPPPRVYSRSQQSHSNESQVSLEAETASKGYSATYKMITGRGFGAFHLWEVTLEARPMSNVLGSPSANNNSSSSVSGNATNANMSYTQKWVHLFQGAVNGPTLSFATLVRPLLYAPAPAVVGGATSSAPLSLWGHCQQRLSAAASASASASASSSSSNKASSLPGGSTESVVATVQVLVSDTHKDLRLVGLAAAHPAHIDPFEASEAAVLPPSAATSMGMVVSGLTSIGKPTPLKDSVGTYAASADGCVLFGGKYDLVVSFLDTSAANASGSPSGNASPNFAFRAVFSLSDFVSGAVGRSTKKNTRHLREISEIWCTPDGAYALILCTDNAVLLYR